jgi:hypothetical protein
MHPSSNLVHDESIVREARLLSPSHDHRPDFCPRFLFFRQAVITPSPVFYNTYVILFHSFRFMTTGFWTKQGSMSSPWDVVA